MTRTASSPQARCWQINDGGCQWTRRDVECVKIEGRQEGDHEEAHGVLRVAETAIGILNLSGCPRFAVETLQLL